MELEMLDASVVVLSEGNNPKLLGVGINYVFVLKDCNHDYIRKNFLQDGPWLQKEGNVYKAAIEFNYLNVNHQFNLKIDSRSNCILFSVNYHVFFYSSYK